MLEPEHFLLDRNNWSTNLIKTIWCYETPEGFKTTSIVVRGLLFQTVSFPKNQVLEVRSL